MAIIAEKRKLDSLLDQATPEEQNYLLDRLLSKVIAREGPLVRTLNSYDGTSLGIFIPKVELPTNAPMSEERYAELLESIRNTTDDQLLSFDEMMQRLGLGDPRQSNAR